MGLLAFLQKQIRLVIREAPVSDSVFAFLVKK